MGDRSSRTTATPVPEAVAYVRDLLAGFGPSWWLCGGWAIDEWLGRQTRDHWDVDIGVLHHDQRAIFEHLAGWALVGHDPNVADDTTEPWNGRHLDQPAHIHVPTLGSSLATSTAVTHAAFEFEFLLVEVSERDLILNRELNVVVPPERFTRPTSWGLAVAAPEVVLFFKAGGDLTEAEVRARSNGVRPRDQQDFIALLPTLDGAQRAWLRESLGAVRPRHPWLTHLGS
jgi:hypothetical protein